MKKEKYTDFFEEAEKGMSKDNIRRAEQEANKIMLNLGLAELRKHAGYSQYEIQGYRQSSVSKIEARKDIKISKLVSYCRSLGLGNEPPRSRAARYQRNGDHNYSPSPCPLPGQKISGTSPQGARECRKCK